MKALALLAGILGTTLLSAAAEDLARVARIPKDERDLAQAAADDFRLQLWDEAAAKYKAIISAHPDCLYAWSNLGVTRFQQGRLDLAAKAFSQAIALNPNDAFCLSDLGLIELQLGQYEQAIGTLKKAVTAQPADAVAYGYLGAAYEKLGRKAEADKAYEDARVLREKLDGP
jgi:Flp pilus assembly protein TadD